MARVIIQRNLPPLKKVLGNFAGYPPGKSRQQVIVDVLRLAAMKLISTKPQPFYSMRDASVFFRASIETINRVYKILEKEGLVSRIRSSHTILVGKKVFPREAVRGIVGIPIWLQSMVLLVYTQTLVMELEERLRRVGYVADFIFHPIRGEESDPEFAERLLRHQLDVAIIHSPSQLSLPNLLTLRERGVRLMVVTDKTWDWQPPGVIYFKDAVPGLEEMVARWHHLGIRKAWFWHPLDTSLLKGGSELLGPILARHRIEMIPTTESPQQLGQILRSRGRRRADSAIVFGLENEEICNYFPQEIEQLAQMVRLGFIWGASRAPYLRWRKVPVDIVDLDPLEVASRLAADVHRLSVIPDGVRHTFVSKYYEQGTL